jgi:hypothetical protein
MRLAILDRSEPQRRPRHGLPSGPGGPAEPGRPCRVQATAGLPCQGGRQDAEGAQSWQFSSIRKKCKRRSDPRRGTTEGMAGKGGNSGSRVRSWRAEAGAGIGRARGRERKDPDEKIRRPPRDGTLAASLRDKLEAQKTLKVLEATRTSKRRELFDGQDTIDRQRDEPIARIEKQLRQLHRVQPIFTVRWSLV